jgi:hypothetical protein
MTTTLNSRLEVLTRITCALIGTGDYSETGNNTALTDTAADITDKILANNDDWERRSVTEDDEAAIAEIMQRNNNNNASENVEDEELEEDEQPQQQQRRITGRPRRDSFIQED